jgi:Holliday junction resolvase RusA-like endonuclease
VITTESTFKLSIPKWENKIFTGVVIPSYYTSKDKIPMKYKGAPLRRFGSNHIYVDEKGKKLVKNANRVGDKIYSIPNGQGLYNGSMHWTERAKLVKYYHRYFAKYIKEQFKEQFPVFLSYSLSMKVTFYEIADSNTPDITNQWFIVKIIEDVFQELRILKDDSPEFRRKTSFEYKFVDDIEDRELVVKFKYKKANGKKRKEVSSEERSSS